MYISIYIYIHIHVTVILCMRVRSSIPSLRFTVFSLSHGEMHGQAVTNGLSMIENLAVAQLNKYQDKSSRRKSSTTKMNM